MKGRQGWLIAECVHSAEKGERTDDAGAAAGGKHPSKEAMKQIGGRSRSDSGGSTSAVKSDDGMFDSKAAPAHTNCLVSQLF